jgi:TonB family protein
MRLLTKYAENGSGDKSSVISVLGVGRNFEPAYKLESQGGIQMKFLSQLDPSLVVALLGLFAFVGCNSGAPSQGEQQAQAFQRSMPIIQVPDKVMFKGTMSPEKSANSSNHEVEKVQPSEGKKSHRPILNDSISSHGAKNRQVKITAGVAQGMLISKQTPVYPRIAKAARVSGTVVLQATISKTGSVENLRVISGPAMLQQSAMDAVKNWRYRPYLLNGEAVQVETTVNVMYSLGQ